MPLVIGIALTIFLWIQIESHKSNKKMQSIKAEFWNKEYKANSTRKVDISSLDYIKIPIEELPIIKTSDEELKSIQDIILNLSRSSILNLTGLSNTDLKIKYGVANITFLSECDSNYTLLVTTISKWGQYLYKTHNTQDAIKVLEFGIQCRTDVSITYITLAKIYKSMNLIYKIDELIDRIESMDTLLKASILTELTNIKKRDDSNTYEKLL